MAKTRNQEIYLSQLLVTSIKTPLVYWSFVELMESLEAR